MANNLRYSLTTSAPGASKGVLCVVVSSKGRPQRNYYRVESINDSDLRFWDKSTQRFYTGTDVARALNPTLDALCALCDELLNNSAVTTPKEFVDALRNGAAPSDVITLGDFLRSLIEDMRNGANNKRPSRNYQPYRNLLHKLEKEKTASYKGKKLDIIDVPLSDVDNKCFIQFSDFLLSLSDEDGRTNYANVMKFFKQVHTVAYNRELTDTVLRFKYTDNAPFSAVEDAEKAPSFTLEQYAQFIELDVKALPRCGALTYDRMQMYKDYCIFLYEMQMRPADVTQAHRNNIVEINGIKYYRYIPEKKKNCKGCAKNRITNARITARALEIIEKYNGRSSQGYIFPFSMNEYSWDMNDAESWNKWNNRRANLQEKINAWLRYKVAVALGWNIKLTLYTFRHSTLTHACMSTNANWGAVALNAGTSIDMLQKHYVSNTITVNSTAR